ncbi:MAG: replication-associated recombination protein A [Patescibacteria group bacterium]
MNHAPLAEKIRPTTLGDFIGQEHLIEKNSFIKNAIENDQLPSIILWGPPGTGKTTLANIIANQTKSNFHKLSAVHSGKKDLKLIIDQARQDQNLGQKTILFIDEIHRWNKAQQDALLPFVENGTITLIGATTENPSFTLNSALVSRSRVIVLNKLSKDNLVTIINRALKKANTNIEIDNETIDFLANFSNGDARMALNTLETCLNQHEAITIDLIKQILQKTHLQYDRNGDEHYNIISALHKSLRGGDPHAAVYWLARMIEAGEDPLYIARRLIRFASEDIGLVDNFALILANTTYEVCHKIGLPECNVNLTHCVLYLAKAKKSILCYQTYQQAQKDVNQHGNLPVPLHLRNAPTKLMKDLNYGKDYKYTPLEDSSNQTYFPDKLKDRKYF